MANKAIQITATGGVEVMTWGKVQQQGGMTVLGQGEVLVKNAFAGVNFIDTYQRSGLYALPLPAILGREGAGIIEAVGDGVGSLKIGDRVAYLAQGTYAQRTIAPQGKVVKLPDTVSLEEGAAALLQGLTALAFSTQSYPVQRGNWILIHAAAGGTGSLLCQVCRSMGARVIGTTSTMAKAEVAKACGAEHVILYTERDVKEEVLRITDGKGVHAVFDGIGADTFHVSLDSLRPHGSMISFGNASGKVPPVDLMRLARGSLRLMRPKLADYIATPGEFHALASQLWTMMAAGELKMRIHRIYDMEEAGVAHEDLQGKRTMGKLILRVPGLDAMC